MAPILLFKQNELAPFAHPHSAETHLSKQCEAEKVAAYGRLPFKSGAVAPAFQHEVVRRRSLHKAEAKHAVYHVVDYYSEKVEFENFVEHKLADGNLHYLRAAVLLAVRFGRYLYFKFHTYILTQRGAALQEHLKQNGSTGAIFAAYGQKDFKMGMYKRQSRCYNIDSNYQIRGKIMADKSKVRFITLGELL